MSSPTGYLPDEPEALFQQLADTHATWAVGAARYGPGGTWDALRKSKLALLSADIRDGYAERGERVTESRLEEAAHAHPDYVAWLDESTRDRALWLALDAERTAIQGRLRLLTYNPVRV